MEGSPALSHERSLALCSREIPPPVRAVSFLSFWNHERKSKVKGGKLTFSLDKNLLTKDINKAFF